MMTREREREDDRGAVPGVPDRLTVKQEPLAAARRSSGSAIQSRAGVQDHEQGVESLLDEQPQAQASTAPEDANCAGQDMEEKLANGGSEPADAADADADAAYAAAVWERVVRKTGVLAGRIGSQFPHAAPGGVYELAEPHWWTAGFWPGLLWLLYRDGGEASLRQLAEECERRLDEPLQSYERLDHDLGFMWSLTSVANYKLTGNPESRRRALQAASHLLGRFNLQGRYIRAWNPWREGERNEGLAIMDCMMNLPLLYWASEESGDPRFRHVAVAHATTTLRHFVRADGSTHHVIRFDPETGEVAEALGGQGYAPQSAWSRGSSWALYGFTLSYKYSGDRSFLDAAKKVAHYFIANLPEDGVPEWDFRLPAGVRRYKDSSAGACAASGLLELARLVPEEEAELYYRHGARLVRSLESVCGRWEEDAPEGLLQHGTGHYPEQKNLDVPLIYGDYFFVEALAKLRGRRDIFW